MNVTPFLNIASKGSKSVIEISGDIGYNDYADSYEEYIENTDKNIAIELQAIKDLKATDLDVVLSSLGGDMMHGFNIASQIKHLGIKTNVYLRGANASMSTVIASEIAISVDNIHMDNNGLYLIHKPMSGAMGNANDMRRAINDLDKFQLSAEQSYLNLGVKQEVITDLMERNGGHGEWLTFNEAKAYGFVGKEWKTEKVSNYKKESFQNKGILIPNIFNNRNNEEMAQELKDFELTENHKESLFSYIMNKQENLKKIANATEEMDALTAENEALKAENADLKAELEAMKEPVDKMDDEDEEKKKVDDKVVVNELTQAELIDNAVKLAIKNMAEPTPTKKVENKVNVNDPLWKQILHTHQNVIK